MFSIVHALKVLELIQELFLDIPNFDELLDIMRFEEVSNAREKKLTSKGKSYQTETLHRNRGTRYTALSKEIKQANQLLEQGADLRELEKQRDILDRQKNQFNEAHQAHHELLEFSDDSEASYHWFDIHDRDYQQC